MIPDFKTYLKESIWSDMQERGTGDIIKTEDISSINNMKKDQFYDFLCDRYKQVPGEKWFIGNFGSTIAFPVFSTKDDDNEGFSVFITGYRKSVYVRDNFILDASDMLEKLQDNFTVDIVYKDNTEPDWAEIYPKDQSKITNYFFVTVIDFLMDNVDTNKYKKLHERRGSLKESVWSDMQERGTGDVIKKEDDVNLLDIEEFYDYLDEHYDNKVDHLELNLLSTPNIGVGITQDILLYFKPERGHILLSWSRVKIKMPFFDELSDRFNVENPNVMRRIITDKDGNCANKTFIDVIDFFIEHKDDLLVNESVWSDMQDRGTGNMTKREDDIDLLDRYGFFAYLNKIYRSTPPSKIRNYDELNSILVPLFGVNRAPLPSRHLSIEMEYNDGQDITVGKKLMSNFPKIEADLRDNFNVDDMPADETRGEYLKIHPKDGSPVTNSFFITVIDFLLEKARDEYTIILFKK